MSLRRRAAGVLGFGIVPGELDGQHQRAQTLAVHVLAQGACNTAAQRVLDDEIERAQIGKIVAPYRSLGDMAARGHHPFRRQLLVKHEPGSLAVGHDRDFRCVALVAAPAMRKSVDAYHQACPSKPISGETSSRGNSTDCTARISRTMGSEPPPAPAGPCMCRARVSKPTASAARRSSV